MVDRRGGRLRVVVGEPLTRGRPLAVCEVSHREWPAEPLRLPPEALTREVVMSYVVDYNEVSTVGLESSPIAEALAGLRANEARYFKNKYSHTFTVEPASAASEVVDWVPRILVCVDVVRHEPAGSATRSACSAS